MKKKITDEAARLKVIASSAAEPAPHTEISTQDSPRADWNAADSHTAQTDSAEHAEVSVKKKKATKADDNDDHNDDDDDKGVEQDDAALIAAGETNKLHIMQFAEPFVDRPVSSKFRRASYSVFGMRATQVPGGGGGGGV
jgi:hypothetical protein